MGTTHACSTNEGGSSNGDPRLGCSSDTVAHLAESLDQDRLANGAHGDTVSGEHSMGGAEKKAGSSEDGEDEIRSHPPPLLGQKRRRSVAYKGVLPAVPL